MKENWDYLREYVRRFMARSKVKTVNHLSKKEKRERSHYRFTSPPFDDGVECVTTYPINNPSRCEITKIVSASSNFYTGVSRQVTSLPCRCRRYEDMRVPHHGAAVAYRFNDVDQPPGRATKYCHWNLWSTPYGGRTPD